MRAVIKVIVMAHMEDDAAPSLDALPEAERHSEANRRVTRSYQVSTNFGLVGVVTDRPDCERLVKMVESAVLKSAGNLSLQVIP
jgi:hypothetical protein